MLITLVEVFWEKYCKHSQSKTSKAYRRKHSISLRDQKRVSQPVLRPRQQGGFPKAELTPVVCGQWRWGKNPLSKGSSYFLGCPLLFLEF